MTLDSSARARDAVSDEPFSQVKGKKRIAIIAIVSLIAVVLALVGIKAAQIFLLVKTGKSFVPPPESVTTAKAEATEWQAVRSAIGSLVAVRGVTLGAEITGTIREILFDNGTFVKKGAVLVRLDTSTEQAQLESARADAELAAVTLKRHR
ncbi:MAG TPA: hypothetical protein VKB87_01775, partial [Myxococcaceae bacterium]|nr:hypothetical protein [Myxococcaceae bacterium]